MLLRKDKSTDVVQTNRTKSGQIQKGKSPIKKANLDIGVESSHLTTDNVLHHMCKLKYPSMGGTPKSTGGIMRPIKMIRKQIIDNDKLQV